jgi:DNA-binding transcriptional LysR family regulator
MEMHQIRYVLAVAKTLSFTKAAAACNISQPALTKGVQVLEAELGSSLFHREGKTVMLSAFGRSMVPHLERILSEAELAKSLAANFRLLNQVPVRLGVMSTIGHIRFSRFLTRFQRDFAGVEVAVSEAPIAELKRQLEAGELDLAVLNPKDGLGDGFHAHELYTERYVVILPPGHSLGQANSVTLADLAGEDYVDRLSCEFREAVMSICADRRIELYARFRSEREDWVQAMVLAGLGFAFLPEYSLTVPELLQRPLEDPRVARSVSLISVPGRPFSPAVAAFMRSAQSFAWPG